MTRADRCLQCGRFVGFYPIGFRCDTHCRNCTCERCATSRHPQGATTRYKPHQYKGDHAMNRTRKALAAIGAIATIAALTPAGHALAYDPVVTATCDTTVVVGTPVHCTVTIDQAGFVPANQRITWRNPRTGTTYNVANYTVIPVTYDGAAWQYTYTPSLGEVGRTETFSVVVAVSAARIPRTVSGAAAFTVVAA